ncbi:Replication termination factor 2 [Coemansia sp. Cherry 401B]|nr:Replication termination factor 2 [Coemansia sp. Cherry 401B]
MGNDGGSIPRRNEMVREKQQDEKVDRKAQLLAMNFFCALSKQPLREPIVGDGLGRLYNRESILEYLLDPRAFGDGDRICGHIKSAKDVRTLNLSRNPKFDQTRSSSKQTLSFDDQPTAQFVCPVTRKEMNGNLPFEFNWRCGCVVSAQARKEMADLATCLACSQPVEAKDIVPINSLDAEVVDSLRQRIDERKQAKKQKSSKPKSKSKAKRQHSEQDAQPAALSLAPALEGKGAKKTKTLA